MRRLVIIGSIAGLCLAGFASSAAAGEDGNDMKLVHRGRSGSHWVIQEKTEAPHALTGQTSERAPERQDRPHFEHRGRSGSAFVGS